MDVRNHRQKTGPKAPRFRGHLSKNWGNLSRKAAALLAAVWLIAAFQAGALASLFGMDRLANPIAPRSADPFVTYKDGYYYFCKSQGDASVGISKARRLQDIGVAPMKTVWTPTDPRYSREIWAPELFSIGDRWYIYVAADNGSNANHRMLALESETEDPMSTYTQKAVLDTQGWAIDGTVFEYEGTLYFVWAGWPGTVDGEQRIYIQRMLNPWTLAPDEPRVEAARPTYAWERVLAPGNALVLNEGPEILQRGSKIHIIYSANASWRNDYLLGMVTFDAAQGGDILDPGQWKKNPTPVFAQPAPADRKDAMAWGPGHASFTTSPDGTQDWMVYHAFTNDSGGWGSRTARAKAFTWNEDDTPNFGAPTPFGGTLDAPSGQPDALSGAPDGLSQISYAGAMTSEAGAAGWVYYGGGTPTVNEGGYNIPGSGNNGAKAVNTKTDFSNFTLQMDVTITGGSNTGNAGPLFRVTAPGSGVDNLNGYGAFLCRNPTSGASYIELNRYGDGNGETTYRNLAQVYCPDIAAGVTYRMKIACEGPHIRVSLNGTQYMDVYDRTYPRGAVGFRTYAANARFANVQVIGTGLEAVSAYEARQHPETNPGAFALDRFDGAALSPAWTVWNNGNTSRVGDGVFRIDVASGNPGYFQEQTGGSVALTDAPAGVNYEVLCRVTMPAERNYQQAGPVIWVDGDHFVKLTYVYVDGTLKIALASENKAASGAWNWLEYTNDAYGAQDRTPALANLVQTDVQYWGGGSHKTRSQAYVSAAENTVTLKLTRIGNLYTGSFWDGKAWVLLTKPMTVSLYGEDGSGAGVPKIGLLAEGNGGNTAVAAEFDWFAYRALPSIDTLAPAVLTTKIGAAPMFPAAVLGSLSDGGTQSVPAQWPTQDPSSYAKAGGFTVLGDIGDRSVPSSPAISERPTAAVVVKPALLPTPNPDVVPKLTALSVSGMFGPEISLQNNAAARVTVTLVYAEYLGVRSQECLERISVETKTVGAGGLGVLKAEPLAVRPDCVYKVFLLSDSFEPITMVTTESDAAACPPEEDNSAYQYLAS